MLYALADGCRRRSEAAGVEYVLRHAQRLGINDARLYSACVCALAGGGQLSRAVEVLRSLPEGLTATASCYKAVASAAETAGEASIIIATAAGRRVVG